MHRRWVTGDCDVGAREILSRALGVSAPVASVLAARGVSDPDEARAFLSPSLAGLPDPETIPGMARAAERLVRGVRAREPVWLYTDYDVDGVTSAALLGEFLRAHGMAVRTRLPRRDREGYGLHADALREMAAQGGGLVVTADCGVTAVEPARVARELGLELVITDHHAPGPRLPDAAAVVNPKLPGSAYPEPPVAGVGVAWNLAAAVRRRLREGGFYGAAVPEPDLRELLDLVALGTVADVVPLRGVNRILVSAGLRRLAPPRRPGLRALCEVAGVRGPVRAGHVGFQLGPRLNAAGRMEGPQEALELLSATEEGRARELATLLDDLNRRRREEEQDILGAALLRVEAEGWWPERRSLVVDADGWHAGVIGIVASRLVERFHRPTVVLAVEEGEAKGSARSIPGFDLHRALGACSGLLTRYGGHAAAAGLQLPTERIPAFRAAFEEVVRGELGEDGLVPVLRLDAEADFRDLDLGAVGELGRLEPFGFGNPTPLFLSRGARVLDVRPLGGEGEHRRFRLEQGGRRLDAVAWRKSEALGGVEAGNRVDVAHSPQVNRWNGRESVQLVVEGMRPAGEGS